MQLFYRLRCVVTLIFKVDKRPSFPPDLLFALLYFCDLAVSMQLIFGAGDVSGFILIRGYLLAATKAIEANMAALRSPNPILVESTSCCCCAL